MFAEIPESLKRPSHIVGIGASAGGLAALEQFFDKVPSDSGMAFVVVQHLSPDFKSLMDNLLSRHTTMPIFRVEDGIELCANAVFLIPPKKIMTVSGSQLRLHDREAAPHLEMPIDIFLQSLAFNVGTRAVGVILSGTGSDGSHGLASVHQAGGLTLVQSPETAQFDGMPRAAIATGVSDFILSPDEMPAIIQDYVVDPNLARSNPGRKLDEHPEEGAYSAVFALLRRGYGIDFSKYKGATVGRRILRRMEFRQLFNLGDYETLLANDPAELDLLYHDLLIGVTEFFRDPQKFQNLEEEVIPALIQRSNGEGIRVWVAACATGEEAYSIAILLLEKAKELDYLGKISVFATDVHRTSLDAASQGIYETERLKNVSPQRLERYFQTIDSSHLRVTPELRKVVVFAHHNLINDPPFTRMDLVSCRNLLIYFQPETQDKVISLFNFALRLDGILFLGSSEGLGKTSENFEVVNASNRIFRKIRDSRLRVEFNATPEMARISNSTTSISTPRNTVTLDRQILRDYDELLNRFIPPGILINEDFKVLHYFNGVSTYLKPPEGRAETDVLRMVASDLQLPLSVALQRTAKAGQPVRLPNLRLHLEEEVVSLELAVTPLPDEKTRTTHFLITFKRLAIVAPPPPEISENQPHANFEEVGALRARVIDLEEDLKSARENLQSAIEELQTSNEELQATNEEMLASNEELQSTNEELHSVNEELYTVNAEFEKKNRELQQLNQDHENLLASIDIGTIFLDEHLNIRKYNPAIADSFKILPQDIGRPLEHLAYYLTDQAEAIHDVRKVLEENCVIEREVSTRNGKWLLKRNLPFRTEKNEVKGVVLTFSDITCQKENEQAVQNLNQELEQKVAERVSELRLTNQKLQAEIGLHEQTLREKDLLMREIHHRVKNNLQVISSLLSLQAGYIDDPRVLELFNVSRERIHAMALIHEKLYQSPHLNSIDLQEYLEGLVTYITQLHSTGIQIAVEIHTGAIRAGIDLAIPCGLVVNELVTNAMKHAFRGQAGGKITIILEDITPTQRVLSVSDNGTGFPAGFDPLKSPTFGLRLVQMLARQLKGTVSVHQNGQTTFCVTFPPV